MPDHLVGLVNQNAAAMRQALEAMEARAQRAEAQVQALREHVAGLDARLQALELRERGRMVAAFDGGATAGG
ncbi:MAG: hypothetical protein AAGH15_13690 [Myxococcota bacterium]